MTHDSLLNELWSRTVARLGGEAALAASARANKAFLRPRGIRSAVDLLRIVLAYCLGGVGMRATTAWAASVGLADLSNVALLGRLRNCAGWIEDLLATLMTTGLRPDTGGRVVRIVDATCVPKAGRNARCNGRLWRIHAVLDLPSERFSRFDLTDEKAPEMLDKCDVVPGEIRVADRGYMRAHRIAAALAAGGDIIVRAGWKQARWLDADGTPLDMMALLRAAEATGRIDRPIGIASGSGNTLRLRLVAFRKSPAAIAEARRKTRREATKECKTPTSDTLQAAEWILLVTSLDATEFPTEQIGELYRVRWRIEMAFKRLKSLIGLGGPPGEDPAVAKTWILAHLLMILLLEPHTAVVEDSPRSASLAA